jgi:3-dehydroquinate synthetase
MSDPRTVPITPGGDASRGYDVAIGEGVLSELGPRLAEVVAPRRALLVHDDRLPDDAIATARDSLAAAEVRTITEPLAASEANKTIDTVNRLLHVMAEAKLDRTDALVALGGGVVGDIAGFAAAIYRRGIPFVQCPTTLLAMVDASVGGKTGVNLGLRTGLKKNLVGAFWQPALVLADTALLNTLPERHLRAGLAECLKHGLIASSPSGPGERTPGELFEWTNAHLLKIRIDRKSVV